MPELSLVKPERIRVKNHPMLNEGWVQEMIATDPAMLDRAISC